MPGSFIDSNVLLYLASADSMKADRAEAIVAQGGMISVQVLNECANVCRRKMRLSWAETRAFLGMLQDLLTVHPLTATTHRDGLDLAERYQLSIHDAVIVASALGAGCDRLWTEDMQHGMKLADGLQIANPFQC